MTRELDDVLIRAFDGTLEPEEDKALLEALAGDDDRARRAMQWARTEALLLELRRAAPPEVRPERRSPVLQMFSVAASILFCGLILWVIVRGPDSTDSTGAVPPLSAQDEQRVLDLIERLGSDDIRERDAAVEALQEMGKGILAVLRRERAGIRDRETLARLQEVIDAIDLPSLEKVAEVEWDDYLTPERGVFHPDGKLFAIAHRKTVRLLGTSTWKETDAIEPGNDIAYSPDGKRCAVSWSNRISVYSTGTLEKTGSFKAESMGSLRFLADGRIVFLTTVQARLGPGMVGPRMDLMVAEGGGETWTTKTLAKGLFTNLFEVSPDGKWIVCGPDVFASGTGEKAAKLSDFGPARARPEFSPDSDVVVYYDGKTLSAHRTSTWDLLNTWSPGKGIRDWAFTPDSRYLLAAHEDGRLRVWRVRDGREVASAPLWGDPSCVFASPTGNVILVGCNPPGRLEADSVRRLLVFRLRP